MPPRALFFDFDGVIADTENHHVTAWQRTFGAMGWEVDDAVCARATEIDDRVFLADVFASRKVVDGNVEGWVLRKQELMQKLLADSPRIFPGVAALVDRVRSIGGITLGVVTTTWRANVSTVLNAAGLEAAFPIVVAKEDVKAVKPDPEAYRLALKRAKLAGPAAIALEDSATGLASASAAGIWAFAVGHREPQGVWSGEAPFLADLRDTDDILRRLGLG